MTVEIAFLDVGNADSIVILPPGASAVVVDVPKPRRIHEWLESHNRTIIDCLYFTHAHQDHFPSLSKLKTFISGWLLNRGSLKFLCLPTDIIRNAHDKADKNREARLRDALDHLLLWQQSRKFDVIRGEVAPIPLKCDGILIHILHPSYLFFESYNKAHPHKVNELSLVLRVEYGEFRVLLLADIEQEGLATFLEYCKDDELDCQVIKIPHHGALQTDISTFQSLLERANPELAVLSVGSQNQYGHVVPQLFLELLKLKYDDAMRLKDFVCTQVTRTCLYSATERSAMGKQGLKTPHPCGGDIVILADSSGTWKLKNQEDHLHRINSIPLAACCGRADLSM